MSNRVVVGKHIQVAYSGVGNPIAACSGSRRLVAGLFVGFPVCGLAFAGAVEHRLAFGAAFERRIRAFLTPGADPYRASFGVICAGHPGKLAQGFGTRSVEDAVISLAS